MFWLFFSIFCFWISVRLYKAQSTEAKRKAFQVQLEEEQEDDEEARRIGKNLLAETKVYLSTDPAETPQDTEDTIFQPLDPGNVLLLNGEPAKTLIDDCDCGHNYVILWDGPTPEPVKQIQCPFCGMVRHNESWQEEQP